MGSVVIDMGWGIGQPCGLMGRLPGYSAPPLLCPGLEKLRKHNDSQEPSDARKPCKGMPLRKTRLNSLIVNEKNVN